MSGYDRRFLHLRNSAMAIRVAVLALLAFLSAPAGVLPGAVANAQAQQQPAGKVYRIGFLRQGQAPKAWVEALQQGLRERGYVEGRNLVWEFRSTDGSLDRLPQFAEELVRSNVDVILASASSAAVAAKGATTVIPIVFAGVYAPVEIGLVPSLGRPGSNITGVAINASDMAGKRVQLLIGSVPARSHPRGQDPEGRPAGRPAHRATGEARAGDQHEHGQDARPDDSSIGAAARRPAH